MQSKSANSTPTRKIARQFNLILLVLYLVSVALATPTIYYVTRHQVYNQADTELALLVDMVGSIQGYVAKHLRPHFVANDMFYSPGFSGIVATSLIAENFKHRQPQYYIKNSSDNPLNPVNTTNRLERNLLQRYRAQPDLGNIKEIGAIDGQSYLVSSAPKVSKRGCLLCHGDPDTTPDEITTRYGRGLGYNYNVGEVVGVSVVGVPLDNVNAIALQRSVIVIGILTGLFALIFISINMLVRRYLISPILQITEAAHAIRKGDASQTIDVRRNDEIGDLARSVELLRRSFLQAIKRLQRSPT
jgi:protein-histidine pros-kinase